LVKGFLRIEHFLGLWKEYKHRRNTVEERKGCGVAAMQVAHLRKTLSNNIHRRAISLK